MNDVKWELWVQLLTPHEHLLPELITGINNGELRTQLDVKRKVKIDVQDIKILLKSISHGKRLDSNTNKMKHLGHEAKGRGEYKNMFAKVKQMTSEQQHDYTEFDPEKYRKNGHAYLDSLIGRKSK
jgi:hypothetical protein